MHTRMPEPRSCDSGTPFFDRRQMPLAERGRVPLLTPHILAADPTVHLPRRFERLRITLRSLARTHQTRSRPCSVAGDSVARTPPQSISSASFLHNFSRNCHRPSALLRLVPGPPPTLHPHPRRRHPKPPHIPRPPQRPRGRPQRRSRRPNIIHQHDQIPITKKNPPLPMEHLCHVELTLSGRHFQLARTPSPHQRSHRPGPTRPRRRTRDHLRVVHPHPQPPGPVHRHRHDRHVRRLDLRPPKLLPEPLTQRPPQLSPRLSPAPELHIQHGVSHRPRIRPQTHRPLPGQPLGPAGGAPLSVGLVRAHAPAAPPAIRLRSVGLPPLQARSLVKAQPHAPEELRLDHIQQPHPRRTHPLRRRRLLRTPRRPHKPAINRLIRHRTNARAAALPAPCAARVASVPCPTGAASAPAAQTGTTR